MSRWITTHLNSTMRSLLIFRFSAFLISVKKNQKAIPSLARLEAMKKHGVLLTEHGICSNWEAKQS